MCGAGWGGCPFGCANMGQRCALQKPDHERGLVSVGAVKQFGLERQLKPALEEEHVPGDVAT